MRHPLGIFQDHQISLIDRPAIARIPPLEGHLPAHGNHIGPSGRALQGKPVKRLVRYNLTHGSRRSRHRSGHLHRGNNTEKQCGQFKNRFQTALLQVCGARH